MSLIGFKANETSVGIQKIPYPLRTIVFGVNPYANPMRGAKSVFASGRLLRVPGGHEKNVAHDWR